MASEGLGIARLGHETRLKWHRLRRSACAAEFSADLMVQGLASGASMKPDVRVRTGGGLVMLQGADLARATTAAEPRTAIDRSPHVDILHDPFGSPVILPQSLAARLPFDMRDGSATIGRQSLDRLRRHFGQSRAPMIISGGCRR